MFMNDSDAFDFLEIGLASPDRIRYWSYGEIEKPETINYRTFKPERKGLFCEKIFGPVKDWECSCGKYRRIRYRGIVCERCGVEVTHSKVRRERMGHIELASPVTHIWFLKGIPGYLSIILDIPTRKLEEVIYYDSYIITEVDESLEGELSVNQMVTTLEYSELKAKHKDKFKANIGADAIREVLSGLKLEQLIADLREELEGSKGQKRLKIVKRLRVLEPLQKSKNQPEWITLDAIPVMPPDLRPMVQLEGGRFATSDLNDLYRRVVNRNNRLKRLMDIGAPEMIIRNEKRMLQEAIDVLISNGKRGRAVTGSNGRPLKSLGNIIEGKQGRFRQNLLGKRVDYSARSVIVVGPHLSFSQCGLPKQIAVELFKPFVIRKLVEEGAASNVKSAKRKIENRELIVWSILEKVIKGKMVLLNRAPTLHRLGIQAFEPILVEGSAIQVHPLVCTAFNADFDGDQMAVHLPLSVEAQVECKLLIESTNNILSPSSGRAIVTPTQDMVLGIYYLTVDNSHEPFNGKAFFNTEEAHRAFEAGYITYQRKIKVKIDGKLVETTLGRIVFNEAINAGLSEHGLDKYEFINEVIGKKQVGDLIYDFYVIYGNRVTSSILNNLKNIGFKHSTLSGISISVDDLTVPESKVGILEDAGKKIEEIASLEKKGIISKSDMKSRSQEVWRSATHRVSADLSETMGELNNVFIMANSGARGNMDQVRQLAGMRGLMSDSQGRTIDIPIRSNFKEGLTLTEYFISAYGARKGLVDTALRTADSGYLTRRLVDVAQDLMISSEDCKTDKGLAYTAVKSGLDVVIKLSEVVDGRVTSQPIVDPETGKKILGKDQLITKDIVKLIDEKNVEVVHARSPFTCTAERGICKRCYGVDLSTAKLIHLGEAIGIIAAQSIGEPGTQLTMRTFHTGGVDLKKASLISIRSKQKGKVSFDKNLIPIKIEEGEESFFVTKNNAIITVSDKSGETSLEIPGGAKLLVKDKATVDSQEVIAEFDPNDIFVFAVDNSTVHYDSKLVSPIKTESGKEMFVANAAGELFCYDSKKIIEVPMSKTNADKYTEFKKIPVSELNNSEIKSSCLLLKKKKNKDSTKKSDEYILEVATGQSYTFARNSIVYVSDKEKVSENQCVIKQRLSSDLLKTQDIVQGLPKVEELFEARRPKEFAVLSELEGIVDIVDNDTYWSVIVNSIDGDESKEWKIQKSDTLIVYSGQHIAKGDKLNEGPSNPHDIAKTKGIEKAREHLSVEVQKVYNSQGVQINRKHIEVIVRQMTQRMVVSEMGEGSLLLNEMVSRSALEKANAELKEQGKRLVEAEDVILGITRASLSTDSFVSASSFQQTASVLTRAAIEGKADNMLGLKENVIIGRLIPAGTGVFPSDVVTVKYDEEEALVESEEEVAEDASKEVVEAGSSKKSSSSKK